MKALAAIAVVWATIALIWYFTVGASLITTFTKEG